MAVDSNAANIATNSLSSLPFNVLIGGPLVAAVQAQCLAARATADFIESVGFEKTGNGPNKARMISFSYKKGNLSAVATTPIYYRSTKVEADITSGKEITVNEKSGKWTIHYSNNGVAVISTELDAEADAILIKELVSLKPDQKLSDKGAEYISYKFSIAPGSTPATDDFTLEVPFLTILPIPYIRIDDISIHFKANITASAEDNKTSTSTDEANVSNKTGVSWWGIKTELNAGYSSKKDSSASSNSKYAVEYTMDVSVHAVQDEMPKGMLTLLGILADNATSNRPGLPAVI